MRAPLVGAEFTRAFRGALGEAPVPWAGSQPVTQSLLPAQGVWAGNLGGARVFAHGTPPHSRRVGDEWDVV